VESGGEYLAALRQSHVASLEAAYSVPQNPRPRALAADPRSFVDEAIGFQLSAELRAQLAAFDCEGSLAVLAGLEIVAIGEPDTRVSRLAARHVVVEHGTDWTTDDAGDHALVPTKLLMAASQQIAEGA
jgi:hypothetical protein